MPTKPSVKNAFRVEYQVVVVRTAPGDGPVHSHRKPAAVAFVVVAEPGDVARVIESGLTLAAGESVDVIALLRVNGVSEKVFVAD